MAVCLAIILGGGLYWLNERGRSLIEQDQVEQAETTADTAISGLKSIMLAGRGDTVHTWLDRISKQPSIDFARIYRVDGVEAFHDLSTVNAVNDFLGEQRFHRALIPGGGRIRPSLKPAFAGVLRSGREAELRKPGELTILYPIHAEPACLKCHGYTGNALRGVLVMGLTTTASASRMKKLLSDASLGLLTVILLLVLISAIAFRKLIIRPLEELHTAAETIATGDLGYRIRSERQDEFGVVARALDQLVEHLEQRITAEAEQKKRQALLTEAVISLSRQTAQEDILRHVGELAMKIVKARYTMVAYVDAKGERHLIPLGVSEEEKAAISHPPRGEGLLGLFWNGGKSVRVNDIAAHPVSIGFPEGHPPMQTLLGVPIIFAGEPLGAIYLTDRPDGKPFSEDDERMINTLASACAIALSNLRNTRSELAGVNRRLHSREIELELMNEDLTHANEAKSQFLANTSHELRTPLNAIIGFSELLKNPKIGVLSDKQKRYVDHVHVSGKRLLTLINDLLDISKIEAGMMAIKETLCQPCEIARGVVNELAPLAARKHITLTLRHDCPDDEQVLLDAGKLQQIIVNLTGNAIKFTPEEGKVDVWLGLKKTSPSERIVEMIVSDTGYGIAPEDQEKIFEPFVQANAGLAREHGGTGLGLALTRRQVNLLGGSIRLSSELGHGSRFTVELPAEPAGGPIDEQKESQISGDTESTEIEPARGPRPRILVIDDDAKRAKAVMTLMEQQDYEARHSDISDAAEQCESLCVYVITLGIPAEEGHLHPYLQTLRAQKATRDLPVILVGGNPDNLEFSTGPVGVVEKGIKQQELLDMISRYCHYIPAHPEIPSVLVIDDELSVREFLRETLVEEGFRVLLACSGPEGVRMAVDRDPDMIILDLMMPKVSGFDVIGQLNRHPVTVNTPIVIYTAKDLSREEALQLGRKAESVLIKGADSRTDLVRQLHKMELLYPVRAHLIDPVLDCFNRRYMERRLEEEVSNAKRHALRFSLVGWQVDNYRAYVDQHGERWGIAALKDMLETVRMVTRRGDICACMDEAGFMLLLPGITSESAMQVSEKLRIRIRHQRFLLPDEHTGELRASFAAVCFGEDTEDAQGLMRLLRGRLEGALRAGGDQGCYGGEV